MADITAAPTHDISHDRYASVSDTDAQLAVRLWLAVMVALVFAMIVVGGATRLTDSGLSITEWKPILGAIPPLSAADWQEAFEKYRQIPEYQLQNKGMSLEAFKFIFWWEWAHRFLGRLIGLAFAVPFVWFWATGRLRRAQILGFVTLFVLGGLQGFAGWYMVQSGLVDRVDVSQYRLALHLTLAMVIFAGLVWALLQAGRGGATRTPALRAPGGVAGQVVPAAWFRSALIAPALIIAALFLQIVLGALVAGMKAGLVYNTWPTMNGAWVPEGLFQMAPWYINAFENATLVQFNHRVMAYVLTALVVWQVIRVMRHGASPLERSSAIALALAVAVQATMGIWTLLAHVPLWLGLVHQGGAAVVLGVAVWHLHGVRRRVLSGV